MAKLNRWRAAGLLVLAGTHAVSPLQMGRDGKRAGANSEYAALTAQVNDILQTGRLDGALAAVSIRKAESGEKIYDHVLTFSPNKDYDAGSIIVETAGDLPRRPDFEYPSWQGHVSGYTVTIGG
ncbi:hypothetical protein KQ939_01925 [Planococcus sp. CP5-4]|uniref:hypothetical protein n=1 Tax=unclassified Planococcus (in: firmicutes) TaxID=2662419 RepID=UPI001C237BF2|nr:MULTISPECIES: hypothetical protein [unclassified Planococcus (in: firmicutes)]MBU9673156.1 hypothetical protein [Planococcus sp. CP5-4_YE]MBW6062464.1 hypothetical protein [Planococcus sp. CP5-4]